MSVAISATYCIQIHDMPFKVTMPLRMRFTVLTVLIDG
jgi:hypothetical protein